MNGQVTGVADNDVWTSTSASFPNWLQYQVSESKVAKQFHIYGWAGNGPRDFDFSGSTDGAAWTTLTTGTCADVTAIIRRQFAFTNNTTSFSYYRLTTTNGYSTYTAISEIDISSLVDMPLMTSSNTPSPFAISASSDKVTFEAWKAFDASGGAGATWWQTSGAFGTQQWVQVDFGSPRVADMLIVRNYLDYGFKDLRVSASSDGSSYTVLMVTNAANNESFQRFTLGNANAYRYYKIATTNSWDASTNAVYDIRLLYAP
jgi:hypothetical protein